MFVQSSKIRSLFSRLPSSTQTDLFKVNQGAVYIATSRAMSSSDIGSGAGKGGGSGGSVRESGGGMGKKGAAQEEMYFTKQNNAMKEKLKSHLKDEIKKHEEAIKAKEKLVKEMDKEK